MTTGGKDRIQFAPEFLERYTVRRLIGEGGSGAVYEAEQKSLGRVVAVKFLSHHLFVEEESVRRFLDEGKITARLQHANIVNIYDFGVMGDMPYAVFEFISGKPLRTLLDAERRLPVAECLRITQETLAGLAHAHKLGVVHRDLKPENLLLEPDGRVKIADFGLAKGKEKRDYKTRAGVVLGTPEYISPEQASGQDATQQSDLYSVGVILYEMLSGQVPFTGSSDLAILIAHVQKAPRPLPEVVPALPSLVWEIVSRSLEKQPAKRYATADEFYEKIDELQPYLERSTREVPAEVVRAVRASSTARPAATPRTATVEIRTGQRTLLWLIVGLVLLVATGAASVFFYRNGFPFGQDYAIESQQVHPGVHTATLDWKSNLGVPGVIELREETGDDEAEWKRLFTVDSQAGVEHRLVLTELKPGTVYQYRFVFPGDSASIAHTFQTGQPFKPESPEVTYVAADKVTLAFRTSQSARLSASFPGTEKLLSMSDPGVVHTLTIGGVNPMTGVREGVLAATFGGDEKVDIPLPPVPSLPEVLVAEIDRMDLAVFIKGLQDLVAPIPAAKRQALFEERLTRERVFSSFVLFRTIASAFFLSNQISTDRKLDVYNRLLNLENVDGFAALYKLKSPLNVAPTFAGLVSRTYKDPIVEPLEMDGQTYDPRDVAFFPENFDKDALSGYRTTIEFMQGEGRRHETYHFTFRGSPDQRFSRAALMCKVSQMPPRQYFEAVVNGRLRLLFRNTSDEAGGIGQPAAEIYNCFWPEFLKGQENTVELRLKTLPGFKSDFNSCLYQIDLEAE